MKRFFNNPVPIDQFPVPWAHVLPEHIGNTSLVLSGFENQSVPKEWLGIVSSHHNKNGFASTDWQQSLHSALHLANQQRWGVMFAYETPYSQLVLNTCKHYHIPFRIIRTISPKACMHKLIDSSIQEIDENNCGILWLQSDSSNSQEHSKSNAVPLHDRASVFLANHLFVVEIRQGGKIAEIVKTRLSTSCIPSGSTFISVPSPASHKTNPTPRRIRDDWLSLGAIGWLSSNSDEVSGRSSISWNSCSRRIDFMHSNACDTHQPIFPIQMLGSNFSRYLVHCTRSRRGPWPDQSADQFHDELLMSPWQSQPSAFDTLHRILTQQRLIATTRFRRSSVATVCFSSHEISKLLSMKRFQSHLARWDWEPYGMMFDLKWLEKMGAKPVSYVDSKTASTMSDDALAFCQVISNESNAIDWREEKEWRVTGDLRLNQIPFSKAIVFVATESEAKLLQPKSRWPIAFTSSPPKPAHSRPQ